MLDRAYVEYAAQAGERKSLLMRTDPVRYLLRCVMAGMFLTLVLTVYWMLMHNLHDVSIGKVIASAFFGVGLTIIVFTNTELFTSNNMYMTVSSLEGKTSWGQAAGLWGLCWVGNFIGAIIVGLLMYWCGVLADLPNDHMLYTGAVKKVHLSASVIFFRGIMANWAVCLAVRLALRMKEEIAKIMILILVVFIFLYLGFEHSIANMGTFTLSLLGNGTVTAGEAAYNLLFSTLGNIVGGALLVAFPFDLLNPFDPNEATSSEKH